ncbi:MAG: CysS/YqeB C-terminal domain-containing protein, partial [Candidatus Limnocylindrales bacterium]
MSDQAPPEVLALAQARSAARAARDWPTADRLRREIEAAGWKVVDDGTAYRLERAHPPDLAESGRTRYGSSGAVPSRLAEPATAPVTVVLLATDWPADLARALAGLDAHAPADTQLLIVADDPSAEQAAALEALPSPKPAGPLEVVWTSARLGHAGA